MIPGSPFQLRAASLNLRQNELHMHDDLMARGMRYWPESLVDFVQARTADVGMCGDVIATAVADWIRHDQ